MKLNIQGSIKDNTLVYKTTNARERIAEFISKNNGHDFIMQIHAIKDAKTYEQLKFYWGVVLPCFQKLTGVGSKTEMDVFLRNEFLKSAKPIAGKIVVFMPSLKLDDLELDKHDFSAYIENCINFLMDLGGAIPEKDYTTNWREHGSVFAQKEIQ